MDDYVKPSIASHLYKHIDGIPITPALNIPAERDLSSLVLELMDGDALPLIRKGKILLGFDCCSVQRFLNILRRYNC